MADSKRYTNSMSHGSLLKDTTQHASTLFPPGIEPFISVYSKPLIDCTFTTLSFMKAIELTLH